MHGLRDADGCTSSSCSDAQQYPCTVLDKRRLPWRIACNTNLLSLCTKLLDDTSMGRTNIHSPGQLLGRASYNALFSDQALISPHEKTILLVSGPADPMDIEKFAWCLRTSEFGSWIERDAASDTIMRCPPDDGMRVPLVRVTPGLDSRISNVKDVRFVLVVQGATGPRRVKVIVEASIERASVTMMAEALNGYSTVFTAAFRSTGKSAALAAPTGPEHTRFEKVASLDESKPSSHKCGLLC